MDPVGLVEAGAASVLAGRAAGVPLPAPLLPGWQGLCASEYALAMLRLRGAVALAAAALASAAVQLAVAP